MSNSEPTKSVDASLKKLDARADALLAALEQSPEQIHGRMERKKVAARQALDKLTNDLAVHNEISAASKESVCSLAENLNIQIDLSEKAARQTLIYARRQIHDAIQKVESQAQGLLTGTEVKSTERLRGSLADCAQALHALDAELEAAELRFAAVKQKLDALPGEQRQAIAQGIENFKKRLTERAEHTGEKVAKLADELAGEFERVAQAFKKLFE